MLTGDFGFGNILRYPLGAQRGIVVVRFQNGRRFLAEISNTNSLDLDIPPTRYLQVPVATAAFQR